MMKKFHKLDDVSSVVWPCQEVEPPLAHWAFFSDSFRTREIFFFFKARGVFPDYHEKRNEIDESKVDGRREGG